MTADAFPLIPVVYVVDDDESVRDSLSSLIRSAGMDVQVFASPQDFLALEQLSSYSCLVLDLRMPGMDGMGLQERMAQLEMDIPIVFITGHGDVPLAVRAMRAGAIDFLNKPFDDTELLKSIDLALSRVFASSHERMEQADLRLRFDTLTPREKQVMVAVAQGKLNKRIAYDLNVTESTVKVHKHNVMTKMRLRSIAELTLAVQRLKNVIEQPSG
jgi:two-component system response regulator FixJ